MCIMYFTGILLQSVVGVVVLAVEVATPAVIEDMVHPWIEAIVLLTAIAVLIGDIPVIEAMVTGICK